jgi:hypothetical protein
MQELVNQCDLHRLAIPFKRRSESISAHVNGRGPDLCERDHRSILAALRSSAIIEEPQRTEGIKGTLPVLRQLGREMLTGLIVKIREKVLAARAGDARGGTLDRPPHRQSRFDVPESMDAGCLATGAPYRQGARQGAGKRSVRAHGLPLSGGASTAAAELASAG